MRALFLVEGRPGNGMSPAARYRAYQFAPYLEAEGIHVTYSPSRPAKYYSQRTWHRHAAERSEVFARFSYAVGPKLMLLNRGWDLVRSRSYDVVVIQRELVPGAAPTPERWFASHRPVVFDIDDAIYLDDGRQAGEDAIAEVMRLSDVVAAGSETLVEYAEAQARDVRYLPTTVDTTYYVPVPQERTGQPVVLWTGTSSNLLQLESLSDALIRVARTVDFRLKVICDRPPSFPAALEVEYVPWSFSSELRDLEGAAVGLMPLEDTPWNRAKCGLKLLIYGAIGIPAIASPVGANERIVLHGDTGVLAQDQEEWTEALITLLRHASLRRQMGRRAREWIDGRWSTREWAGSLAGILREAAAHG